MMPDHHTRLPLGSLFIATFAFGIAAGCGGGSTSKPPGKTYFQRVIQPILSASCSGNTSGCHKADPDDPFSFAAGNLDVTSYANLQKRRDVLQPFGPYPVPLLLVKATGGTGGLGVTYNGQFIPLEVRHAGGAVLSVQSDAYLTLLTWIENGATEDGLPPKPPSRTGTGSCTTTVPGSFDPSSVTSDPTFAEFKSDVEPVLGSCNAGSCHGAPQADFHMTCGKTDNQIAYNFSEARAFIADPVGDSPLLLKPLAVSEGGSSHTGGDPFASTADSGYQAIAKWAKKVGPVDFGANDPGKKFFAQHIQPILVTRGCSFEACHSPENFNDFKLRPGSQGFFSSIVLQRNYDLLRNDFMALEVPDVRRSRAVAKTILPEYGGIAHRGGPVLTTPGAGGSKPSTCPDPYDASTASAYCTFQQWLNIERQALITKGQVLPLGDGDTVPIVYVQRNNDTDVATPLQFDTYQPNSDLLVADATLDASSSIVSVGAPRSLLDNCPGASDRSVVDVSAPDVRYDGTTVAFAMRTSKSQPREIYTVNIDGTNCKEVTPNEGKVDGILIHNFDPAWSPDGTWIVYASTRGGSGMTPTPSRSRKLFLPQSDIWRIRPDGSGAQQMTFLTNSEIEPQLMRNGRVIMTTEKVSEGFYQLSGRRMNWDLTDYHPLLAQRAQSPLGVPGDPSQLLPSVGYQQATELREAYDGNFLLVLSDAGAKGGAGTLATFNRSVGPFEADRKDPGFLKSMHIIDPNATGRVGSPTNGAYRSPFPLPDGTIMASYAPYKGDLAKATSFDWDIVSVDRRTGKRKTIIGGAGQQVEAVLALKYPPRENYLNRRQLVFGGGIEPKVTGGTQWAALHIPNAPLIFTLVNANLRRGRPLQLYSGATQLAVYQELKPPPNVTTPNDGDIYQKRKLLGRTPLAADGSVRVRAPSETGIILELDDASNKPVVTMREEHQLGPGEVVNFGVGKPVFDSVCGGCHGSISGSELDITVTPDVLTNASESLVADKPPAQLH